MTPQEFITIRHNLGLSQTLMGKNLGVCLRTIQRYEAGDIKIPEPIVKLLKFM